MTKEVRLIFDVGDIIGVRFECQGNGCTQEFLCRLDDTKSRMPLRCPSCDKQWRLHEGHPEYQILQLLQAVVSSKRPESPVIVKLEMECEETD